MRRSDLKRIAKPAFVVCLGLILYLIAANSGAGWLYVVAAVIGAVVIVSAPLPWWNVRGIEVERRAPVQTTAGVPFECTLEIKNTGRLAWHLLEVEDHFTGGTGRAVAVRVGRHEPEVVRYTGLAQIVVSAQIVGTLHKKSPRLIPAIGSQVVGDDHEQRDSEH